MPVLTEPHVDEDEIEESSEQVRAAKLMQSKRNKDFC